MVLGRACPCPDSCRPLLAPTPLAYLVVSGSVWDRAKLLRDSVAHRVGLAILDVDGANEQIVGYVVQVTTEFEPGACSRDVVGGALPFDLRGWAEDSGQ